MKVIFVNWTLPYFHRENSIGYRKIVSNTETPSEQYDMEDYEILIQKVAVINAKKFLKVPTKLYTDKKGFEFYREKNLLHLFDEIDVDTLETYQSLHDFDVSKFWTSGKVISICNEEPPFLFLDNDFIIESKLPDWIFSKDLVHTQWEIQRGEYFVSNKDLSDYNIDISNFEQNMLMPNTSFLFVNNKELQSLYLKEHLKIVNNRYEEIPDWIWLLSDQGILGYTARKLNLNVDSIEDKMYLSYHENDEDKVGNAPMWIGEESNKEKLEYDHIHFGKYKLKNDIEYRTKRMIEWNSYIISSLV